MSDYIAIDNTCPEIKLYQQYQKNDPAVNFFRWVRDYWQVKYFDYVLNTIVPQLTSCDADTEYLQFFARYWYGILRPVDVTGVHRYDDPAIHWDDSQYDYRADAGVIGIDSFKAMLDFILDWTEHDWNVPLVFKWIEGFTGLSGDQITVEQDSTRPDVFLVGMPNTEKTALFTSLVQNYRAMWNLPYGITFEITLS